VLFFPEQQKTIMAAVPVAGSALIDARVVETITRHMESLRGTIDGGELYGLVSRVLRKHGRLGAITGECLSELHAQLEAYANDAVTLPGMRIRARLIQQHIGAFLPDFDAPSPSVEQARSEEPPRSKEFEDAPIIEELTLSTPATSLPSVEPAGIPLEGVIERPSEQDEHSTSERTEKYQALLRSEKDAWQAIYGTVKDYHKLKQAWMKSLDELARQRDALEEKLLKTSEHMSTLEAERDKLRTDLEKTRAEAARRPRLLPASRASRSTARGSALPRREAFAREVDTEIKRIKRSGSSLALGLIAIEGLERLAEEQGAEACEAVLRCYANEILSNFRAYDRVALYDRDLYAVLFPDTRKEGAHRALEKAHKRATETHVAHEGRSFPLPSFVGVLVLYAAGEDSAAFVARADEALERARASRQTGIVLA
jgi:diguanylate cyclase (GGDEF)-like protein